MKRILIICSWVLYNGKLSPFFTEQAKLISNDFDVTLINIEPQSFGILDIFRIFSSPKSTMITTEEGLPFLRIIYPQFAFLPKGINRYCRDKVLKVLNTQYKLSSSKDIIVHAQSIFNAGFWGYALNAAYGTQYLITEHNQFFLKGISQSKIDRTQQVLYKAKHMLMVSHDKARQILNQGLRLQFKVIGNYVDERMFYPGKKKDDNVFKLITIGAYHHLKDVQTIFDMLKLLDAIKYEKKIEFTYVGFNAWGGDHTAMVNKKIEALNLHNITIKLIPLATRLEVSNLLKESDLFLLSSISEGMSVSILEALATGLPVCTTQCGGVDELIKDFNGKIVPLRDSEAMFDFTDSCIKGMLHFDKEKISKAIIAEYGNEAFKKRLLKYYTFE